MGEWEGRRENGEGIRVEGKVSAGLELVDFVY